MLKLFKCTESSKSSQKYIKVIHSLAFKKLLNVFQGLWGLVLWTKGVFCLHVCTHLLNNGKYIVAYNKDKGNNKITELRTILQRESQNS